VNSDRKTYALILTSSGRYSKKSTTLPEALTRSTESGLLTSRYRSSTFQPFSNQEAVKRIFIILAEVRIFCDIGLMALIPALLDPVLFNSKASRQRNVTHFNERDQSVLMEIAP
jgi:hypothetical protein